MASKNTKNAILALIKQNPGIRTKDILASNLNLTEVMIHRHLKDLLNSDKIVKIGSTPMVKYYYKSNMTEKTQLQQKFLNWAITGDARYAPADWMCPTRDIFQARQERLLSILKNQVSEHVLYLLVGAVGEIGNNSFDHNLGNWRDMSGVLFATDTENRAILLADRGQGVYSTIKRVRPQIDNDEEAVRVAFTEMISGRAPEQRGNGLKYAKKIIMENNLYLEFNTGLAIAKISTNGLIIKKSDQIIPGVFAYIKY